MKETLITVFKFENIYSVASVIEGCVDQKLYFEELIFEEEDALKPNKLTLLHHYIFRVISLTESRRYRKDIDLITDEFIEDPKNWYVDKLFKTHNITFTPFTEVYHDPEDEHLEELIYSWFRDHEEAFEHLWEIITEEVFHVLFANRTFLRKFNLSLAEYLLESEELSPDVLTKSKRVKRTSIPVWLKRAIFHRDKGRCVMCQKDLTGIITNVNRIHLDHIVPLAHMGTNDPTNFQLLCESCNLKKSDTNTSTSYYYEKWF